MEYSLTRYTPCLKQFSETCFRCTCCLLRSFTGNENRVFILFFFLKRRLLLVSWSAIYNFVSLGWSFKSLGILCDGTLRLDSAHYVLMFSCRLLTYASECSPFVFFVRSRSPCSSASLIYLRIYASSNCF